MTDKLVELREIANDETQPKDRRLWAAAIYVILALEPYRKEGWENERTRSKRIS